MDLQKKMFKELKEKKIFDLARNYAFSYADNIDKMDVFPSDENLKNLEIFGEAIPDDSASAKSIISQLNKFGSPATTAQTGGRYFGFVNGGVLPISVATKWLADFWDQNGGMFLTNNKEFFNKAKVLRSWGRMSTLITDSENIKKRLSIKLEGIEYDKKFVFSEKGYNFEIFVWRDCTVPLIRNSDIKKSINILKKEKCQTVTAVYRQHLNPYHNIVEITSHGFLQISKKMKSRVRSRQEAPPVFQENGLHTYDVKKFLKSGKTIKSKSIPLMIPPIMGLMIDTEFEFQIAKWILENKLLKSKKFLKNFHIKN